MKKMSLIAPTGHLGFTPIEKGSFYQGLKRNPDFLIADSGSCDIGPYPLGGNTHASPEEWQRHDLEVMLTESRKNHIPMVIGSASDTGADVGVNQFVRLIKEITKEHKLPPYKLGIIYSEVLKEDLRTRMEKGVRVEGLDGRQDLTMEILNRTDHIVAVMGVEPIIKALNLGADVIIAGRSSDSAIFAAPAIRAGFSKAASFYLGKALECASFCAEPFMGKESVIGTVTEKNEVFMEPMHPDQRCTVASIAGHSMYERTNPFYEAVPGGRLDMTHCRYEQYSERVTRITAFEFHPSSTYKVKLEGSGRMGERALAIVGIRDPYTIGHMDQVIEWARGKVRERYGEIGKTFQLYYHLYGKNGVMGEWEPKKEITSHEVCIVVEAVASTFEQAEVICAAGARNLFYARLPQVKGTAGTAALMSDEVLRGKTGYEWTLNHLIPVEDPMELFQIRMEEIHP